MIFSPKKEFALYFESRFFGVYFSFKTTFHKQVLYSSKTLNKLSCHHLFIPTQPYPRFAYFRPKPSTAEPARFSRAGRKTHCIPFASAHLQSVRSGQISSARCAAMCQPSARSADKMTFVFCIPFSINQKKNRGFQHIFIPFGSQTFRFMRRKIRISAEKKNVFSAE